MSSFPAKYLFIHPSIRSIIRLDLVSFGQNLCCSGLNGIDKNFFEDKTGHRGVSKPVWSGFGLDAAEQNAWKHPLNLYDECLGSF